MTSIGAVLVMCNLCFQLPDILDGAVEYEVPHPAMSSFSIERSWEKASTCA